MTKGGSSRNNSNFDSDSDVSDPMMAFLLNCINLRMFCVVKTSCVTEFFVNKNLKLENSFDEITSLQSMHNDMSAKPCENCNMIMVSYTDLWIVHTQVVSQLKGVKLELKELKACSSLLGARTNCPMLKSDLETCSIEIKELKQKLDHSSRYKFFSPPSEVCGAKENSVLKQEVTYLSLFLERIIVNEKMIENDLSQVEKSAIKSTYKLSVGFKRCEDKCEKSVPMFLPSSNYHKEKESLKPTKIYYPSNLKPSFNPKRGVKKNTPNLSENVYICMFCGRAGHLDEFCF
jgi:hypothetical protein